MKKTILSALFIAASATLAHAQLTLSHWSITTDTLSFDISGTTHVSTTPDGPAGVIWLAAPGNGTWVNDDMNPDYTLTGSVDGHNMTGQFETVFSFRGDGVSNVGFFLSAGTLMSPVDFDFTDAVDNEVNLHVELSYLGKYNPANIDPATLDLFWGGDAFSGGPATAQSLGLTYSPVPEPATWALLGGLVALGAVVFRRSRTPRTA